VNQLLLLCRTMTQDAKLKKIIVKQAEGGIRQIM
jgi:hypothetical protein